MAGFNLLEQYGLTEEEIPEDVGRRVIPDGTYPFTIVNFEFKQGTDDHPETEWIILDHDLGEEGEFREWFTTVEDGDPTTDKVKNSLSFLRKRLAFFGQTLASIDFEPVIGLTGTLTLSTTQRGQKAFQNVTEYSIDENGGADDQPAEEPDEKPMALARPGRPAAAAKTAAPRAAAAKSGNTPFGGRRRA